MIIFFFRLYVMDREPIHVEERLRDLCESRVAGHYEIEVVDIDQNPDLAKRDNITCIPTVVRHAPPPQRRVTGDISDDIRTADALGLPPPWWLSPDDARPLPQWVTVRATHLW